MAERNFDKVETLGRKKRVICGRFKPEATDVSTVQGNGFGVAYTSAGTYTVTFQDKYAKVVEAEASLVQATRSQDVYVQSCEPVTAGTLVIQSYPRGAAAPGIVKEDLTVAAGTYVTFMAVLDDQSNL